MTADSVLQKIEELNSRLELLFSDFSTCFPQLLSVKKALSSDSSSIDETRSIRAMEKMLSSVGTSCVHDREYESSFFSGYGEKYTALFSTLNSQLNSLNELTARIDKIKSDSEEMELIALNAMVISIKSGEKGRAFSCITENLKRLSGDMILYSGRLIQEDHLLIEQISLLQKTYTDLSGLQQSVTDRSTSGTDVISRIASRAFQSLTDIIHTAERVLSPIVAAMEGIQMQDIIRQSLDQVVLCFKALRSWSVDVPDNNLLDSLSFNKEVLELSRTVMNDVANHVKASLDVFTKNWIEVRSILDSVESARLGFLNCYLNRNGGGENNLFKSLDEVVSGFQSLMADLNHYQAIQKNMVSSCTGISDEVMNLQEIFNNLSPVINKLGHVRISQQIEVAKNPAISSVKNTVSYMDSLITNAATDLEVTKKQVVEFVDNVDRIVDQFATESTHDNLRIVEIKNSKSKFFSMLKDARSELSDMMNHFTVYPPEFNSSCAAVDKALTQMSEIYQSFCDVSNVIEDVLTQTDTQLQKMLADVGQSEWHIHDNQLRDLITRFTITAHKEQAGAIGGFAIEHGISAGEITLF